MLEASIDSISSSSLLDEFSKERANFVACAGLLISLRRFLNFDKQIQCALFTLDQ
jgi:hypothetical protein